MGMQGIQEFHASSMCYTYAQSDSEVKSMAPPKTDTPTKIDPNTQLDDPALKLLKDFRTYVQELFEKTIIPKDIRDDAIKVIECLMFIKVNRKFITYAGEYVRTHEQEANYRSLFTTEEQAIYTYKDDKNKDVLRDFNDTSMHFFQGYENLLVYVNQIEATITFVNELPKDDVRKITFVKLFKFEKEKGCLDDRTALAMEAAQNWQFPVSILHIPASLDQQFL
jgi:hypothetical protein